MLSRKLKILRILSYLYLLILLSGMLFDGTLSTIPNVLIAVAIFTTAILVNRSFADKIIGYILLIAAAYMLLAITVDLPKVKKVTSQTIIYFTSGYGIFSLAFAASLFILCYKSMQERHIDKSSVKH